MSFLPIVERELRTTARLKATYRNRALAAGVVAVVALFMMGYGMALPAPSYMGATMFRVLSYLTLGFCLLEGARKTADCVSEEKRDGTLGLLFLTDLKGYDVILGKLAANSLSSIYGLLAILPVLGLPLLMGGVTPGEYWRVALALLNILFFSLCAGMFMSSLCRDKQRAMGGTVLMIAGLSALPLLSSAHLPMPMSPVHAFLTAFDRQYLVESQGYWQAAGLTQIWSWLLLIGACLVVPHSWQEKAAWTAASATGWRAADTQERTKLRTQMLEINPIYWLVGRQQGRRSVLYGFAGVAVLSAVIFILSASLAVVPYYLTGCWLLNMILKMRVAAQACRCHAEARRNNSLEMLLVTPITAFQIIDGQIEAIRRLFILPTLGIVGIEILGLVNRSALG